MVWQLPQSEKRFEILRDGKHGNAGLSDEREHLIEEMLKGPMKPYCVEAVERSNGPGKSLIATNLASWIVTLMMPL